ncbi:gamma carbonic anhydrase family protein [Paraburkholderia sediminicola]|uniref:gamma carbonic anhydrase family protein n=1 Tax=Paraburkholderia sediminicola TaxID=458836 RepID=UPI0038B6D31E
MSIERAAFVHPSSLIYGAVTFGEGSSAWLNATIRAEMNEVRIGAYSNIQDGVMIHVGAEGGTIIGEWCSISHRATLHGCTIGDNVLVGIGATIMDGCEIGSNCVIAGHSFLKEGTVIPPNSVVMGMPAAVKSTRDNRAANRLNAWTYWMNALAYVEGHYRLWSDPEFLAQRSAERVRLIELPE